MSRAHHSSEQILTGYSCLYFGDCGKGKLVDEDVERAKQLNDGKRTAVVRFQGGPNAGHTTYIRMPDGTLVPFVTHAAPSGLTGGADVAWGPHGAFDPELFLNELHQAQELFGYDGQVLISERVGILMDYHRQLDAWQESLREQKIGTTQSGIGPFYQDNARRDTRITFHDYVSDDFPDILRKVLELKSRELDALGINRRGYANYADELLDRHEPLRRELQPFAERLEYRLREYLENGDHIIVEGAQGTYLDVDMGTIPTQTASHLLLPYAFPGLGLPRRAFKIYGVVKSYPTRVGSGAMPTHSAELETVVDNAGEFGATTGRRRRAGWPDPILLRRAAQLNDCDALALTRADCVQGIDVKVCAAYTIDGKTTTEVPYDLASAQPVYMDRTFRWDLWEDGLRDLSKPGAVDAALKDKRAWYVRQGFSALPQGLREFVGVIEDYTGVPVEKISIGPARGETICRLTNPS